MTLRLVPSDQVYGPANINERSSYSNSYSEDTHFDYLRRSINEAQEKTYNLATQLITRIWTPERSDESSMGSRSASLLSAATAMPSYNYTYTDNSRHDNHSMIIGNNIGNTSHNITTCNRGQSVQETEEARRARESRENMMKLGAGAALAGAALWFAIPRLANDFINYNLSSKGLRAVEELDIAMRSAEHYDVRASDDDMRALATQRHFFSEINSRALRGCALKAALVVPATFAVLSAVMGSVVLMQVGLCAGLLTTVGLALNHFITRGEDADLCKSYRNNSNPSLRPTSAV